MTPIDALWLFEWSTPGYKAEWTRATDENPGTWVWVHDRSQNEDITTISNAFRTYAVASREAQFVE